MNFCTLSGKKVNPNDEFCNSCGFIFDKSKDGDQAKITLQNKSNQQLSDHSMLNPIIEKFQRDNFHIHNQRFGRSEVLVATQIHLFAFVSITDSVSIDTIQNYSSISLTYAIKNKKGLPRGFQTGVTSFALLISDNIDIKVKQWVQQISRTHFVAMEMPVLFDISENNIYYFEKSRIWGYIYYKFFRSFVKEYFYAPLIKRSVTNLS